MAVKQWLEEDRSRSATVSRKDRKAESSVEVSYLAFGTSSDTEVHTYANTFFSTNRFYRIGDYVLMVETYSLEYLGDEAFRVRATYKTQGEDDPQNPNPRPLKRTRSFDTTGGTTHITQAESETRFSNGEPAAPNMNKAIGVDGDKVNGVDIVLPALKWTETYDVPNSYVTAAYIKTLASMTGTVNDGTFRTFAAGEVLFVGCSGSQQWDEEDRGNGPWSLSYKFVAQANAGDGESTPALTVGDIADIEKDGHDYMWIYYEDDITSDTLLRRPKFVYVNEVYRRTDFSALGLGNDQ